MTDPSRLARRLAAGQFAVTSEIGPPKSSDATTLRAQAATMAPLVDAVNVTDNQTAIVRMASWGGSLLCQQEGAEAVLQVTCRDRNRLAIQSDILAAGALGLHNVLCLTGDHLSFGNHPTARAVFDLDSLQLLLMLDGMRKGTFANGEAFEHPPQLFLGAAANPFAEPAEFRAVRLAKKVAAGADFIQTQIIFNLEKFHAFMEQVCEMGMHEKVAVLAGVAPIKGPKMAAFMAKHVPGIEVPAELIERMEKAKDPRAEGLALCVETIAQVREVPGVSGIHLMPINWEESVPEILERAGLANRPALPAS